MITRPLVRHFAWLLVLLMTLPPAGCAQKPQPPPQPLPASAAPPPPAPGPSQEQTKAFSQEELDQILAPIALYPDSLLSQVLMASTYPLEIVQAERWLRANDKLQGDALAKALEQQDWDPSVKSLINFPQILTMMSDKLDWTQKLGDAFLAQQADVMTTVQKLRAKAREQGNLESTAQQKVTVEQGTQTIIIEPADPEVIYVPTYNPTVVYGTWWYPAYPPYYYYPPTYVPGAALFSFGAGVAVGAAWGYAWGGCDWGHHDVDINVNRNYNLNQNINRSLYQNSYGRLQGNRTAWQHNPAHRQGVAYRDPASMQRYQGINAGNVQSREQFRGRAEAGRQDIARGGAGEYGGRDSFGSRPQATPYGGSGSRDRGSYQQRGDSSAFSGYEQGSRSRDYSSRGYQSMSSSRSSGYSGRSSSGYRGGGGGYRGGGGGGRGGGGRR